MYTVTVDSDFSGSLKWGGSTRQKGTTVFSIYNNKKIGAYTYIGVRGE